MTEAKPDDAPSFAVEVLRAGWQRAAERIGQVQRQQRRPDPCQTQKECGTAGRCLHRCGIVRAS